MHISNPQVSQPRRIGASYLVKRLRPSLGNKVGLRLGRGVRDESAETVLLFSTCGYIVKLMAYHPEFFKHHTHIIFDEVHERSIDADLLCMFTCQLMDRYPRIRVVLMSATPHTDLYKSYFRRFSSSRHIQSLYVGEIRFPIEYVYIEDVTALWEENSRTSKSTSECFDELHKLTTKCGGQQTVSLTKIFSFQL